MFILLVGTFEITSSEQESIYRVDRGSVRELTALGTWEAAQHRIKGKTKNIQ